MSAVARVRRYHAQTSPEAREFDITESRRRFQTSRGDGLTLCGYKERGLEVDWTFFLRHDRIVGRSLYVLNARTCPVPKTYEPTQLATLLVHNGIPYELHFKDGKPELLLVTCVDDEQPDAGILERYSVSQEVTFLDRYVNNLPVLIGA